MQEVVKKEIIKWLDIEVSYPIKYSDWLNPIQCVTKKGGMSIFPNQKGVVVAMNLGTRWRICMDYQKLNASTKKYHFPMLFVNQMLNYLASRGWYCFLDGCFS